MDKLVSANAGIELQDILTKVASQLQEAQSVVVSFATLVEDEAKLQPESTAPIYRAFINLRIQYLHFMEEEFNAVLTPRYSEPLLNWIDDPKPATIKACVVGTELNLVHQEDRCNRACVAFEGIQNLWTDLHRQASTADALHDGPQSRVWGPLFGHNVSRPKPTILFATRAEEGVRNTVAIRVQLARLRAFWRRHLDTLEEREWASAIAAGPGTLEHGERDKIEESWRTVSRAWEELSSQRHKLWDDLAFAVRCVPDLDLRYNTRFP